MSLAIRPLESKDLEPLRKFADAVVGQNYFSLTELEDVLNRSSLYGVMCSFILADVADGSIKGFRLTFPPGLWSHGKGQRLSQHLWHVSLSEAAYFQSLFVSPDLKGQGWGRRLSLEAISALKRVGAKAVVCHSWVESPGNSSFKYLSSLGFQPLVRYSEYWKHVDYVCTRCGKPCVCTAEEMILYL